MPCELTRLLMAVHQLPSDKVAASREKLFSLLMFASHALGLVFAAGLLAIPWNGYEAPPSALVFLPVGVLLSVGVGAVFGEALSACSPLAESKYCTDALDLVQRSSWARQIRDSVIASHRQLYVRDYLLMKEASRHEEVVEAASLQRRACAELHSGG
ncbi:hypothetical protein WDL1P1_00545 (plasmid) [Variovorax sp. WDL1]|nr:hypothetical protein [uncultured bacterium]PNG50487.1 hypothetical protein CHC06_06111 [Variovorax sp. B2]PNG51360.1 hypothetical protein CHC07_06017 [Variovorax sp. B4]VTU43121.1 hypothetical protein H6P1_00363 [Variovorax sp. PBL-H6]VTU43433.1 hypothetical protein SRS16P1_00542 [Variovorax sp. SRS16]VTU43497.1 hypothetical protein E5P1_00538 [Variovorax sp. PBL-E5]VTV17631.1 hypothetical protein WDL1P1_00545 [Variovorax sp. WDL1]